MSHIQSWKFRLFSVNFNPFLVSTICLFKTPIISNVFPLRHSTIDEEINSRQLILRVLVYDTLRLVAELVDGHIVPPLLQVIMLVKLSTLVVKTMGYFVSNNHANTAIVEAFREMSTVEQGLKDPGRKHDIILVWAVESVDNSGGGRPP